MRGPNDNTKSVKAIPRGKRKMKSVRRSTWGRRYKITDDREKVKPFNSFFPFPVKENKFLYTGINTLRVTWVDQNKWKDGWQESWRHPEVVNNSMAHESSLARDTDRNHS